MQDYIDLLGDLSTGVIAVATIVLAFVTWNLARVSKREPFVVGFMESSLHTLRAVNFIVKNTGNATAFDIKVNITPALPKGGVEYGDETETNRKISILPPEQSLSSEAFSLKEPPIKTLPEYRVTVSWAIKPKGKKRETVTYTIGHVDDFRRKWTEDGLHEIRQELKESKKQFEKATNQLVRIANHFDPPK